MADSPKPGNQSRSPSSGPPPARQKQGSRSQSRRGRSRTPRSMSAGSEADSDAAPARQQQGNRRRRRQGGGGGLPGVDEVGDLGKQVGNVGDTAKGAVDQVGNTVGGLAGGNKEGGGEGEEGGGGDKPLKLRLDLNLDVAVELKAKVHGDLTLSLLGVNHNFTIFFMNGWTDAKKISIIYLIVICCTNQLGLTYMYHVTCPCNSVSSNIEHRRHSPRLSWHLVIAPACWSPGVSPGQG
ncbi:hypothetical protein WG66_005741, partial [Moniliophthora roreri]